MRLLICGVPGAGKTTFGEWLYNGNGYTHFDLDHWDWSQGSPEIKGNDIIITWGFIPDDEVSLHIFDLICFYENFIPFWFDDGFERKASYRKYISRDGETTRTKYLYYRQLWKIDDTGIANKFERKINPFIGYAFRNPADIYNDLLTLL